jgi:hypothetical protein
MPNTVPGNGGSSTHDRPVEQLASTIRPCAHRGAVPGARFPYLSQLARPSLTHIGSVISVCVSV